MIYKCATCGKEFDAMWPDLWTYRRGGTFLCSWSCMRKYDEGKGSEDMARMKKDGTEAKKPGPKPKPKVELQKVDLVYDESIAEEYRREQAQKLVDETIKAAKEVLSVAPAPEPVTEIWTLGAEGYVSTAIKKDGVGEFYYDRKHGTIDWENEYGEEISLLPADWMRLAEEIPKVMKILGADAWT